MPGAGSRTLGANPDVVFLMNHTGSAMARTGGPWNQGRGTLDLVEKPEGGSHVGWLKPERGNVRDLMTGMDDGMITQMSNGFVMSEGAGDWTEDFSRYMIHDYEINR